MTIQPSEKKYFLCNGKVVPYEKLHENPNAHIIGHLVYLQDEGRKVSALALWETPVATDTVPPIMPPIVVHLVGDARNIRCRYRKENGELCSRYERWEIGKAAFLALMGRYNVEVVPGSKPASFLKEIREREVLDGEKTT